MPFPDPPAPIAPTALDVVDTKVARLAERKAAWLEVPIAARIDYLQRCLDGLLAVADHCRTNDRMFRRLGNERPLPLPLLGERPLAAGAVLPKADILFGRRRRPAAVRDFRISPAVIRYLR